ncbi:cell wall-binding repeat-containing protein [Nostocoides sp. Soil756]|uniref:cell wall-binding repeat-containing protein n=1 Tax=Nostocoides sp. Soil756 TaxID=1736399 RepID=UPI000700F3AF|nr:cell wall-binding repeat-containing protein [Tetrasphaera sp. Soil756]KRE62250.1 hypothetical protein ASG78_04155 [Tetrasphaera sp. Soil756]
MLTSALLLVGATAVLGTTPASAAGPDWTLRGSGWGHGIGMSQYGASEMADDGYTAAEILGHYYTGTTYDAVPDDAVVAVNLEGGVTSTRLETSALSARGGAVRVTAGGTTGAMTGAVGAVVTVTRSGTSVRAACSTCTPTSVTGTYVQANWNDGRTLLWVDGTPYESGTLVVWPSESDPTLQVVNKVRVHDEYLDHLREVPWSWSPEALKAQAAAARGYVLAQAYKKSCYCHVYDDARSQVYGGRPTTSTDLSYWPRWKAAVRATGTADTGYVVRYDGRIISAFYSSSSGGRTQANEDVWGGDPIPYLRSVDDPWSLRASNPNRLWSTTVSGARLASAFGLPDVASLDLSARTTGGGVDVARARSASGAVGTLDGERFRSVLGLKGTTVRHDGDRIGGATRYDVAAAVAARIPVTASAAVIASGESAAVFDASVSGPLAGTLRGPLLLTTAAALPAATRAELDRRRGSLTDVYVVGGPASVSDDVLAGLTARYPGVTVHRLGGADRYAVAGAVAREIRSRRATPTVVVASGTAIADALGASGPAAALYYPILLTSASGVPAATRAALDDTGATIAHVVGGPASVSPAVETALEARGMTVRRLGGADRYEVAATVATYYRPRFALPSEIVMTSGANEALADSLAAGSLKRLMVLTAPTGVPAATLEVLRSTPELTTVTVVGGPASVPDARLQQARNS